MQDYDRAISLRQSQMSCNLNTFLQLKGFLDTPLKRESLSTMTAFWGKGITVFAFWLQLVMAAECEFSFCTYTVRTMWL